MASFSALDSLATTISFTRSPVFFRRPSLSSKLRSSGKMYGNHLFSLLFLDYPSAQFKKMEDRWLPYIFLDDLSVGDSDGRRKKTPCNENVIHTGDLVKEIVVTSESSAEKLALN